MHDIKTDTNQNRIHISLSGKIDEEEAREASNKVITAIDELEPGFALVNDMTEYKPISQEAKVELVKVKEAIDESGVGTVVRVAPDSPIANMQMDRAGEVDYRVEVASSIEEANAILDEKA